MPTQKLRDFLDANDVRYVSIRHSPAFTAQEIAASAHIPGQEMAKTVMIRIDDRMAMAVLPASYQIDFGQFKLALGGKNVKLATEDEFRDHFPGCEVGAMPPFGNLYGMDVYVAESLTEDEEIAFNAGSHTELIRLSYADFERLVDPIVISFAAHSQAV